MCLVVRFSVLYVTTSIVYHVEGIEQTSMYNKVVYGKSEDRKLDRGVLCHQGFVSKAGVLRVVVWFRTTLC